MLHTLRLLAAALLLAACASAPRRTVEGAPDDPAAPEATNPPLRPTLVANTRTFLPPAEEPAAAMDHGAHGQMNRSAHAGAMDHSQHGAAAQKPGGGEYACPMHPTVKSAKPDTCPKCGMKLEKKAAAPKAAEGAQEPHEHNQ